jgi:hypothetical protein
MFRIGELTPSPWILVPILLLPWTHRHQERRIWVFWGVALAISWLLAAGPSPAWLYPAGDTVRWWAPFTLLQSLPLGGWFHWPNRLFVVWCLVGAAAAGRMVTWSSEEGRPAWLRWVLALGLVAISVSHPWRVDRWPVGVWEVPSGHPAEPLASLEGEGAVLDLPVFIGEPASQRYQVDQLVHGRPILAESHLNHLRETGARAAILDHPAIDWMVRREGQPGEPPVELGEEERQSLMAQGIRFIVLHQRGLDAERFGQARRTYQAWLGPPMIKARGWVCWDLISS